VIGPFGDNVFIDWYAGMPPYTVTPLEGIRNKVGPGVRVRYAPTTTTATPPTSPPNPTWPLSSWATIPPATRRSAGDARLLPSEGKEAVDRKAIDLDPAQLNLIRA
jgi:beta-glucosidase